LICFFVNQWSQKEKVIEICTKLHIGINLTLFIGGLILSLLSYPFFQAVFDLLKKGAASVKKAKVKRKFKEKKISLKERLFLLAAAILSITLFSQSSFLYPFNTWVDANCFFTVGKCILRGLVPYKDIYEQKGPALYFLHSIAAMVSSTSFIGVYFIEIAACYFVLYYSYKIALLFMNKSALWYMPAFSFLMYGSALFCEGDSAEELCLPLLAYALYLSVRWFKEKKEPSALEFLFIGMTSGFILWVKFTILGFYIGWIIVPLLVWMKNKEWKKMFASLGWIVLGVLVISTPILLYFWHHDALKDLFTVYFYNNIFVYGQNTESTGALVNIFNHMVSFTSYRLTIALIILSLIDLSVIGSNSLLSLSVACTFAGSFVFALIGANAWPYYYFQFNLFTLFGFLFLVQCIHRICFHAQKFKWFSSILVNMVCLFIGYTSSVNVSWMFMPKSELPQYQFKETIEKYSGDTDITLLNYRFLDGGFYTVMDVIPPTRFFCQLNIWLDEMWEEMDECVNEGKVDYVVTNNFELDNENYVLVDQSEYPGTTRYYYLYRKVES
jgi:hypothetical protein